MTRDQFCPESYRISCLSLIFHTQLHPQIIPRPAHLQAHNTLKTMLKTYSIQFPGDWDIVLPFLLSVMRDSMSESGGFTTFEKQRPGTGTHPDKKV